MDGWVWERVSASCAKCSAEYKESLLTQCVTHTNANCPHHTHTYVPGAVTILLNREVI